jgi:hypothetical protein
MTGSYKQDRSNAQIDISRKPDLVYLVAINIL